jgi:hypothetical protein
MGLLSGVLLLPLAPLRGVEWVAGQLLDAAERDMCDPAALRARLAALNSAYEAGEIDEDAFEREEERLLDLLEQRTPTVVTRARSGTADTRRQPQDETQPPDRTQPKTPTGPQTDIQPQPQPPPRTQAQPQSQTQTGPTRGSDDGRQPDDQR